ncbi:MAG: hypothetical protein ACMUIU_11280 [bacterium]
MKLLIFDDQKPHEDFPFIGEARVDDVQKGLLICGYSERFWSRKL